MRFLARTLQKKNILIETLLKIKWSLTISLSCIFRLIKNMVIIKILSNLRKTNSMPLSTDFLSYQEQRPLINFFQIGFDAGHLSWELLRWRFISTSCRNPFPAFIVPLSPLAKLLLILRAIVNFICLHHDKINLRLMLTITIFLIQNLQINQVLQYTINITNNLLFVCRLNCEFLVKVLRVRRETADS